MDADLHKIKRQNDYNPAKADISVRVDDGN